MLRLGAALLCLAPSCLAGSAAAGQLKVSPIRVDLSAGQPMGVVKVGNAGESASLIHVRVRAWHHLTGLDAYDESNDVLVNPMIFKLEPGDEQLIRIGLRRPQAKPREVAYRVFIQEVPQEARSRDRRIATLLRISLPIFVAPEEPDDSILVWRVEPRADDQLVLSVENAGNLHTQISSFALLRQGGAPLTEVDGRTYVLAGQRREWVVPRTALGDDAVLTLTAASDKGPFTTALRLDGATPLEAVQR